MTRPRTIERDARNTRDDEGSTLIIATIVMLVLSTLALTGLARTLSTMALVSHGQQFDSALAVADAGLNDAIYRLKNGSIPNDAGWTWPTTPNTEQTISAGKSFRYKTTKVSPTEYEIESVGRLGDVTHGIRARIERGPAFALFANDRLQLGGTGAGRLGLDVSAVLELGGPSTEPVHVGSNNEIQVGNSAAAGDFQHTYGNASCSGCPSQVEHPGREYAMPPVTVPTGSDATDVAACDNMQRILVGVSMMRGSFAGVVDGRGGDPYICNRDVKLGALTVVNGPLVIYVMDGALDMSGALINSGGKAYNLQVYKSGNKSVTLNGVLPTVPVWPLSRVAGVAYLGDITFTGYLYAPDTDLTINADQWWKGAIHAKSISATNQPLITLTFDEGLTRTVRDWAVSRYGEIPTTEADVA